MRHNYDTKVKSARRHHFLSASEHVVVTWYDFILLFLHYGFFPSIRSAGQTSPGVRPLASFGIGAHYAECGCMVLTYTCFGRSSHTTVPLERLVHRLCGAKHAAWLFELKRRLCILFTSYAICSERCALRCSTVFSGTPIFAIYYTPLLLTFAVLDGTFMKEWRRQGSGRDLHLAYTVAIQKGQFFPTNLTCTPIEQFHNFAQP
jgi:hypothetical protein